MIYFPDQRSISRIGEGLLLLGRYLHTKRMIIAHRHNGAFALKKHLIKTKIMRNLCLEI